MCLEGGYATLSDNDILSNTAIITGSVGWGGGALLGGSVLTLSHNTIQGNRAAGDWEGTGGGAAKPH